MEDKHKIDGLADLSMAMGRLECANRELAERVRQLSYELEDLDEYVSKLTLGDVD